ncbi:MAG: regulator [Clostridia bacterium]|nr:regulator [Clostridia bacterium]
MKNASTEKAPKAAGPYSQAIVSGNLIFVSGQLGVDKDGNLGKNIVEQTENAIKNLSEILLAAGSNLKKVVKTTCFLADVKDFAAFNEVYANYFTEKPARSLIQAAALPKGSLVELEAIAEIQ